MSFGPEVFPGTLIDGRYRLERQTAGSPEFQSWIGTDSLLARPVIVHLIGLDRRRTLDVLDEARRMAAATDARFIHVLDVVLAEEQPHTYIVCEHVAGETLTHALAEGGRFDETETSWAIQEIADALAAIHAEGLAHGHLTTDAIVLSRGRVKIQAFVLEAALAPRTDDPRPPQRVDVAALADLLYACLTARSMDASGRLPLAPSGPDGRPVPATSFGAETWLSSLAEDIAAGDPRVATAVAIADVFDQAARGGAPTLGGVATGASADAWDDDDEPTAPMPLDELEAGPHSVPTPDPATPVPPPSAVPPPAPLPGAPIPAPAPSEDDADDTARIPRTPPVRDPNPSTAQRTPLSDQPEATASPTPRERPRLRPHPSTIVLAVIFVAALVFGLVKVFVATYANGHPAAPATIPVASASAFDPQADGGDAHENDATVPQAVDGNPATAWTTERYGKSPRFNDKKPGVGVLLDLGSEQQVSAVTVTVGGTSDVEIRVPSAPTASAPTRSASDFTVAGTAKGATGTQTISLAAPATTRYVLVYLTSLPKASSGTGYQGSIAEVTVHG